jgi:hypothetical protein
MWCTVEVAPKSKSVIQLRCLKLSGTPPGAFTLLTTPRRHTACSYYTLLTRHGATLRAQVALYTFAHSLLRHNACPGGTLHFCSCATPPQCVPHVLHFTLYSSHVAHAALLQLFLVPEASIKAPPSTPAASQAQRGLFLRNSFSSSTLS